ncbi:MAG TPA: transglutaminase domain-containing protein [Chitinophagaceae bacterium]|nr:transglutaminase domain-containing protein [Chitinophagaceae bacterium]
MRNGISVLLCLALVILLHPHASAQDKLDLKFGKVTPQDFDLSKAQFDSSAGAVYIADVGLTEFEGNNKTGFSVIFKRQVRIKILNKNGFDIGSFEVPVYDFGDVEQKLEKVKAVTYNLENGKVVEAKLDEKSIFKDKLDKYYSIKKFTLPALKEGSIIEVSYNIKSDNYIDRLPSWSFQDKYPRLWSEYEVRIPQFLNYVFLAQGNHPFHIKKQNIGFKYYTILEDLGTSGNNVHEIRANVFETRWVMKDVPPLKDEGYVASVDNYNSRIEFQLSELREPFKPQNVMSNWFKVSEELMKDEDFGATLDKNNSWLDGEMKGIVNGASTPAEKAKKIYNYVRNNFTCTDPSARFLESPLKTVFKNRNGNVCDINLLLIAMLRHQGINAEPVLLSTRNNGLTHDIYPIMSRFNYVVAAVDIDDKRFYLDATEPKLGFGKLPVRCYNGHARIVNPKAPYAIYFYADSLKETRMTSVFLANGENNKVQGSLTSKLGYYESLNMREKIAKSSKDELLKNFKSAYPSEIELKELEIDSVDNVEQPVSVRYNLDLSSFQEDIVYFNPMMAEGYKDNYFKSEQRQYPVQMPYTMDQIYVFNMEIPNGYDVDELPKSARVNLNDDEGSFEYLISKSGNNIMLRSRVKLNKANFLPEDYEGLRNFFDYVVKKHSEQIVFKKKK